MFGDSLKNVYCVAPQKVGAGYAEGVEVPHRHEGRLEVGGEVERGDEEGELGDADHEGDKVPDGTVGVGNSIDELIA